MARIASQEHRDGMVGAYFSGCTLEEAAALFGYSKCACSNELKRRNIPRRQSGNPEKSRKHALNEAFFDTIDNEEKAYWLGFFSADGCVGRKYVYLGLAIKDRGHLVDFLAALESEHPIYEREGTGWGKGHFYAAVTINSVKLSATLQALGVTFRKSLTLMPCKQVPEHLVHHYWRGCIDGDGCISVFRQTRGNSLVATINLTGSEGMTCGFSMWVNSFLKTAAQPRRRSQCRAFRISYGGRKNVQKIIEHLYCNSHIWLNRKHEKALAAMEIKSQRQDWSSATLANLNAAYVKCGTWKATAKALRTSRGRLFHIRRRLLAQEQSNTAKGI